MSFSPDEMADLIVKLLTPGHEYLTGCDIIMDGGKYAMSVTKQMEESSVRWAAVPPAFIIRLKRKSPLRRTAREISGGAQGAFFCGKKGKAAFPFLCPQGKRQVSKL